MQCEEIVLLFYLFYLSIRMIGASALDELFFRLEGFAARAIESDIFLFVDISCFHQFIPEFLCAGIMRFYI